MLGDDLSDDILELIDSWVLVVCANLGDLSMLDDDTKSFIEANKLGSGTNNNNSDDEFHILLPPQVLLEAGYYSGASGDDFVESNSGATLITGDGKFYTNQLCVDGGTIGGLSISSNALEVAEGGDNFIENVTELAAANKISVYDFYLDEDEDSDTYEAGELKFRD